MVVNAVVRINQTIGFLYRARTGLIVNMDRVAADGAKPGDRYREF